MEERAQFRECIVVRKEKEKALTDLLSMEKIDLAALTTAIDQAAASKVNDRFIQIAYKKYEWLKYCKDVE